MAQRSEGKEEFSCNDNGQNDWKEVDFRDIELGERIGGGGVGIVFNGHWNGAPVALKTLFDARISADLKKEFMDELLVMSRVRHSNIVKFLGACVKPPNLCFIMELCETSLFSLLHVDRIRLSTAECYQAAIDIASAVEYLHAQSPAIIHRDLKSHNVLRSYDGSYKLCDFGLVTNTSGAGTPAYMAPELLQNGRFTKAVDCYAVGIVLWEIFTAEIPFHRVEVADIVTRVSAGRRPPLPGHGLAPRLLTLVSKCWSQSAEERPSAPDIVDELLDLEKEAPVPRANEGKDALDDILLHK